MAVIKQFVGELRPYFITWCKPVSSRLDAMLREPKAINQGPISFPIFATISVCDRPFNEQRTFSQYDDITNAMQSYPSGHTANSFAAACFLSLYLNAKLKAFADSQTHFWKAILVVAPLIAAAVIACSVIIDRNHHGHDVLLSIPIGVVFGLLAYRAQYRSLFRYQSNHIPWIRGFETRKNKKRLIIGRGDVYKEWPAKSLDSQDTSDRHARGTPTRSTRITSISG